MLSLTILLLIGQNKIITEDNPIHIEMSHSGIGSVDSQQAKHFFIEVCWYGHFLGLIHIWMSMLDNKIKADEYEYSLKFSHFDKVSK